MPASPTPISAYGLSVALPPGWDGRIFQRPPSDPREQTNPIVHGANFALPGDEADFGSDIVGLMGPDDVFFTLLEYNPAVAGDLLFQQNHGMPIPLKPGCFSPGVMQKTTPSGAGAQFFFNQGGRAFTLYIVLGDFASRFRLLGEINSTLETIAIGQR